MDKIIFFGNGPLADATKSVLEKSNLEIIFHAHTKADLETVKKLKQENPEAHGILASFGVLIKQDLLDLFEPEGILNLHPSKLPDLRGASPIESAILRGDTEFFISIMKLVKAMDAGPVHYQTSLTFPNNTPKSEIYEQLATAGTTWLVEHLDHLPDPKPQKGTPTFCDKFTTTLSPLDPENKTAEELNNQIRAFQGFPKSRYTFFGHDCIILKAHPVNSSESLNTAKSLFLTCKNNTYLIIDQLQPAGKKPMDARSFINGYGCKEQKC